MSDDATLLRSYRSSVGITQNEAAKCLGISDATVKSIETGRRTLSPQVKGFIVAHLQGEMTSNDTALSLLTKSSKSLKNGDPEQAVRLAYAAVIIIST